MEKTSRRLRIAPIIEDIISNIHNYLSYDEMIIFRDELLDKFVDHLSIEIDNNYYSGLKLDGQCLSGFKNASIDRIIGNIKKESRSYYDLEAIRAHLLSDADIVKFIDEYAVSKIIRNIRSKKKGHLNNLPQRKNYQFLKEDNLYKSSNELITDKNQHENHVIFDNKNDSIKHFKESIFGIVSRDSRLGGYHGDRQAISQIIYGIFEHEGAYSCHPNDNGGETLFGISRVYNKDFVMFNLIDSYCNANHITNRHAKRAEISNYAYLNLLNTFAKNLVLKYIEYFPFFRYSREVIRNLATSISDYHVMLSMAFFFSFHSSVSSANKMINAMIKSDKYCVSFCDDYISNYYQDICKRKTDQKIFLKGWLNRLNASKNLFRGN